MTLLDQEARSNSSVHATLTSMAAWMCRLTDSHPDLVLPLDPHLEDLVEHADPDVEEQVLLEVVCIGRLESRPRASVGQLGFVRGEVRVSSR